jgi:hypothetical protein
MSAKKKKNHDPAAPPTAADPEPSSALSVPTLVRMILCLGRGYDTIRFDTLCAWVVCGVTAEECMETLERYACKAPYVAAGLRDDSARCAEGLRLLVEEKLAPLVERGLCVLTGDGPDRTVTLEVARSPELLEAEAEVQADFRYAWAGAQRAVDAGVPSDDEVRLRAAAALRHEQDPIIRRLLADAALDEVRRAGRGLLPPAGSTPPSGPGREPGKE